MSRLRIGKKKNIHRGVWINIWRMIIWTKKKWNRCLMI
jgi:Uncharacterized protein containing LysM domain